MSKTVVGLFSSIAQAQQVKESLLSSGYESNNITVVANDTDEIGSTSSSHSSTEGDTGTGIGEKISHFFKSLTGGDEEVHSHYASGVNEGGALLAITVPDQQAAAIAATLRQHGARDIEGGAQTSTGTGYVAGNSTGYAAGNISAAEGTVIPVVEEELVVGKREVDRGGVRVYSHVVETPVEADVTLREEHINVERRPVNRQATAADFAASTGSVIELNATGEEAVVGKSSRVVEEVLVGKTSTEHEQTIADSVRRTEVEIEKIEGTTTSSATTPTTTTTDRF